MSHLGFEPHQEICSSEYQRDALSFTPASAPDDLLLPRVGPTMNTFEQLNYASHALSTRHVFIVLLLSSVLLLSACGDDDSDNASDTTQTSSSSSGGSDVSGDTSMTSSGADTASSGADTASSGADTTSSGGDTITDPDTTTPPDDMMVIDHGLVLSDAINDLSFGSCQFTPCDGVEMTGEWNVLATCVAPNIEMCAGATITVTMNNSRSAIRFGADGMFVRLNEVDITTQVMVPSNCTMGAGCDLVGGFIPGATGCVDSVTGDGCDCTVVTQESDEEVGTWSASGQELTVMVDGQATVLQHCSDGIGATLEDSAEATTFTLERR